MTQAITIYLSSRPLLPVEGIKDVYGEIRIGSVSGWDFSRPLTKNEIAKIEYPERDSADMKITL
jgi:hypothetical protein